MQAHHDDPPNKLSSGSVQLDIMMGKYLSYLLITYTQQCVLVEHKHMVFGTFWDIMGHFGTLWDIVATSSGQVVLNLTL